ncbi:MAG: hypothetical protein WC227_01675 [Patescibacteria group bacterium]|jgi:hypothetical protein
MWVFTKDEQAGKQFVDFFLSEQKKVHFCSASDMADIVIEFETHEEAMVVMRDIILKIKMGGNRCIDLREYKSII